MGQLSWERQSDGVRPVRVDMAETIGQGLELVQRHGVIVPEKDVAHRADSGQGALGWDEVEFVRARHCLLQDGAGGWVSKATAWRVHEEARVDALLGNGVDELGGFACILHLLHFGLRLEN